MCWWGDELVEFVSVFWGTEASLGWMNPLKHGGSRAWYKHVSVHTELVPSMALCLCWGFGGGKWCMIVSGRVSP